MKVLVAGGAGFIGSNLVDALLAEGHNVVCVDNFFIGTRQNIAHLKEHPRFKFYEQDLCDLEAVKRIFEMEEVEFVFHMAANSDIQASAKTPEVEFKNTYTTTFNILEAILPFALVWRVCADSGDIVHQKLGLSSASESENHDSR